MHGVYSVGRCAVQPAQRAAPCCAGGHSHLLCIRRRYQVIQRGHDRQHESLFDKLGLSTDSEIARAQRSPQELRQALVMQAMKLQDPRGGRSAPRSTTARGPASAKSAQEVQHSIHALKSAYRALQNDVFRANYAAHHYASNDVQLHILSDGGAAAALFNPEHQNFTFIDHAAPARASATLAMHATSTTRGRGTDGRDSHTMDSHGGSERDVSAKLAAQGGGQKAPIHGADIVLTVQLTLEESLHGCSRALRYAKVPSCTRCRGSGVSRSAPPRACPQCLGCGAVHLPSATYHIARPCSYCAGDGTAPAPHCRECQGQGCCAGAPVMAETRVRLPRGVQSYDCVRLRGLGHAGGRGGRGGDLVVTVMVSEHRYFHAVLGHTTSNGASHANTHGDGTNEATSSRWRSYTKLHAMLPISLSTALLGGIVRVPTLSGRAQLHIPSCVRNGEVITLTVMNTNRTCAGQAMCSRSTGSKRNEDDAAPSSQTFQSLVSRSHSRTTAAGNAETGEPDVLCVLCFHILILIPHAQRLTGRQKGALRRYEEEGGAANSEHDASAADEDERAVAAESGTKKIAASTAFSSSSSSVHETDESTETVWQRCAELKEQYKHWFSSSEER